MSKCKYITKQILQNQVHIVYVIPNFGILSLLNLSYLFKTNYMPSTGLSIWDINMNKSLFPFQRVFSVFDRNYSFILWFKYSHLNSLALCLSFIFFFSYVSLNSLNCGVTQWISKMWLLSDPLKYLFIIFLFSVFMMALKSP